MVLEVPHILDLEVDVSEGLIVLLLSQVRSLQDGDDILEHYFVAWDCALELLSLYLRRYFYLGFLLSILNLHSSVW